MGNLNRHPICRECEIRHPSWEHCVYPGPRAKDDPQDEAYVAPPTSIVPVPTEVMFKRELATRWAWRVIDGHVCIGMEGNLDTTHDATLMITGGFLFSYTGEHSAHLLAQHLVDQHNKEIGNG